jgi:curved DNA-binding protein CbpA
MSSSPSGKFQDHYILLGIEPNADSETIQAAYVRLAEKYHPDNPDTGDEEKFEALNLAYEVLSDPTLRAGFDKIKGVDHESGNPKFSGTGFFHALAQGALLRSAVLCILYDRRRIKSFKPSLSMRHLENMLYVTADELNFTLWYLKQRGLVINDDKSSMEITVEGMDYLEKNQPPAEAMMQFIKADALVGAQPPLEKPLAEPEKPAAAGDNVVESKVAEPVLNILNRAIQRNNASEESLRRAAVRAK